MGHTEYRSRLESILGSRIESGKGTIQMYLDFHWDTAEEARALLAKVRQQQKELRLVKKEVTVTMKEIRSQYTGQKAEVQAGFWATLGGRKAAGRDRAIQKENLRRQQLVALSPYQSLTEFIDQTLVKLDGVKLDIENWMSMNQ